MTIDKNLILLSGLQQRVSHPRLTEPAPSKEALSQAYLAAFRSPDHAWLRPWRFIECRETERVVLGDLLAIGLSEDKPDLEPSALEKVKRGPLRAPLVIVCYAHLEEHPKVPIVEQIISVGCAVNNLANALFALGYGSVWRTGESAYSSAVHRQLAFKPNEIIVGYLYVGTAAGADKVIPELVEEDYVMSLKQHMKRGE